MCPLGQIGLKHLKDLLKVKEKVSREKRKEESGLPWRKERKRRNIAPISFVLGLPHEQVLDCEDISNFSGYLKNHL